MTGRLPRSPRRRGYDRQRGGAGWLVPGSATCCPPRSAPGSGRGSAGDPPPRTVCVRGRQRDRPSSGRTDKVFGRVRQRAGSSWHVTAMWPPQPLAGTSRPGVAARTCRSATGTTTACGRPTSSVSARMTSRPSAGADRSPATARTEKPAGRDFPWLYQFSICYANNVTYSNIIVITGLQAGRGGPRITWYTARFRTSTRAGRRRFPRTGTPVTLTASE
jgi:hypothetical protein